MLLDRGTRAAQTRGGGGFQGGARTPEGQTTRSIWDEAPAARGGRDRGPRTADSPEREQRGAEFGCSKQQSAMIF